MFMRVYSKCAHHQPVGGRVRSAVPLHTSDSQRASKSQLPSPLITPRPMALRLLPDRQMPAGEATHFPSSKSG